MYVIREREKDREWNHTAGVSLNGVREVSVPEVPVTLAGFQILQMLLRRHGREAQSTQQKEEEEEELASQEA